MRKYDILALYPDGEWRRVGTTETIAPPVKALHAWIEAYQRDNGTPPRVWTNLKAVQIGKVA